MPGLLARPSVLHLCHNTEISGNWVSLQIQCYSMLQPHLVDWARELSRLMRAISTRISGPSFARSLISYQLSFEIGKQTLGCQHFELVIEPSFLPSSSLVSTGLMLEIPSSPRLTGPVPPPMAQTVGIPRQCFLLRHPHWCVFR